jgi:hypothetical protein
MESNSDSDKYESLPNNGEFNNTDSESDTDWYR